MERKIVQEGIESMNKRYLSPVLQCSTRFTKQKTFTLFLMTHQTPGRKHPQASHKTETNIDEKVPVELSSVDGGCRGVKLLPSLH